MPGEFGMYFFDGKDGTFVGGSGANSSLPPANQVERLTRWVCIKNGLYSALEMLAVKFPFAAGVGRKVGTDGDTPKLAVDQSAKGLMGALRQLPKLVWEKVYDGTDGLLKDYIDTWKAVAGSTDYQQYRTAAAQDEDKAIYGDMAPEGRLELVLSLIENTYAIHLRLIQGRYPLINLFDIYLEQAARGAAGASIAAMANGK